MPLKLSSYKDSPNWRCRGTVRGITFDRSTKTADREAAEALRIQWESELLERSIHGQRATACFPEALVSYLKAGGEKRYCTPLLDHFGETPLVRIDQAALDAAATALKPEAGPATRNRQIYTPMAAILHHAAKRGWTDFRRIERPKEPRGRVRWLKPAEAERLIKACAPHLRPLVIFLLGTGARLSEGLYLDWKNVDLAARRVRFMETKNGEPRGVPLHDRVLIELANLPHREGAVFRRPASKARRGDTRPRLGKPYGRRSDGGGQIKTAWAGACKRAGFADRYPLKDAAGRARLDDKGHPRYRWRPRYSPPDCRHSWASWFYAETRDIRALMDLGGWKSMKMVERYTHLNPDHLKAAIDRLPWEKSGSEVKEAVNS